MRTINFIFFFTIVLVVYGLVNYYIFIRGWQSIPQGSPLRIHYLILFLIFASSFITGRILERFWLAIPSNVLIWIGSFWLSAMLYFFLIILLLDFLRLINHWLPFFPSFITGDYVRAKQMVTLVSTGAVVILIFAGYINSLNPRIKTLRLTIPKPVDGPKTVNLVIASDIHLGTLISNSRFNQIVDRINQLKPDIVLLPGDIVDEDLAPVIKYNLGQALRNIKSTFGVIAITGNHEYIGGVEKACKYLSDHNVTVLRDSVIMINNSFYIIGREDRSIKSFTGKTRKPLEELLTKVDKSYPLILLDHQPFNLEQAVENGIDLQISGHTHHGQLWPFNYITNMIYEVSWGYKKKENTQVYVSSGVGTWGPPVRLGNRPEIVNIKLSFK
jgi:predicted MPP superfamily phosphohydrolase